jgi:lipid-A-disaccharide synthase-like uncharacterized protein
MIRIREWDRERVHMTVNPQSAWTTVGFLGQVIFGSRFLVQWIATERQKRSVVPTAFWYLSIVGTVILLSYSVYRLDAVFIAGFSLNMVVYLRNLYFIHRHPVQPAEARSGSTGSEG